MNLPYPSQSNTVNADRLQNTTALIYYEGNFISSAIVLKLGNEVCSITAGHSIYGKDFNAQKDISKINVQISNIEYNVKEILGTSIFAKQHDIVILKVDCSNESIEIVKFTAPPINQMHSLVFRGRTGDCETINNIRNNHYDEPEKNTTKYKIDCNKEYLKDHLDNHGSDWMGGVSGSGLFYEDKEEIFCCGIILEILDKGNAGKVLCASIPPLAELQPELQIIDNSPFDSDSQLTEISLGKIIDEIDLNSIKDWEKDSENDPRITHINSKLPNLYPLKQLELEKRELIKRFMVGKVYLHEKLSQFENLNGKYNEAYKVFTLENKTIYANSKRDARNELNNIKNRYEQFLSKELGSLGFDTRTVMILKEYAISEWISNCSISIFEDE